MRQIAYPAAFGGYALGLGAGAPAFAAEWSVTPLYSATVDYDTNRRLDATSGSSESAVLTTDLRFKRAVEDLTLALEPRYSLRRFSDPSLGNGDDRSIAGNLDWLGETSSLSLSASYWDQSVLSTEVFETGLLDTHTHRHLEQGAANYSWSLTESRKLIAQLSYEDISYHGGFDSQLRGYRYPSGSLGEQFVLSERLSVTVSAYGNELLSASPGNSSHEEGLQGEVDYAFSEQTTLDAALGESSRVLAGVSGHGTTASINLNHVMELGRVTFGYSRSLVPYGVGFLVERQQVNAVVSRSLTEQIAATVSYMYIRNNDAAVRLGLARGSFSNPAVSLSWRPAQNWTLSAQLSELGSEAPRGERGNVSSWRSAVGVTWTPRPLSTSW